MSDEEKLLLLAIHERMESHRKAKPPKPWKHWERRLFDEEAAYGPRYTPAWFGGFDEARRQRFRRALTKLEAAGLVALDRPWGVRIQRVKLTKQGVSEARRILAEATP